MHLPAVRLVACRQAVEQEANSAAQDKIATDREQGASVDSDQSLSEGTAQSIPSKHVRSDLAAHCLCLSDLKCIVGSEPQPAHCSGRAAVQSSLLLKLYVGFSKDLMNNTQFRVAEEAGVTNALLLIRHDEPLDKRQQRIKQLLDDMPAVMKSTEESEATAAAAATASQAELPSHEKVMLIQLWNSAL